MDRQVKEELSTLRDFLGGRSSEAQVLQASDKATRQAVAEELLLTISRADEEETSQAQAEGQERARQLFMNHGYFDEAVQDLRGAQSPHQRAAAAHSLGVVGSNRGTPHLIAAMFDDDAEVRNAAEQALAKAAEASALVQNPAVNQAASQSPSAPDQTERTTDPLTNTESPSGPSVADEFDAKPEQATQETVLQESHQATRETSQDETIDDAKVSKEAEQLLLEEQALRETVKKLERQLLDATAVRTKLEKDAVLSVERETRLRAETATRRREEEETRKRVDEEAERRRSQEREALKVEQVARAQAETESHRIAEEEVRMRLEMSNQRKAIEELVWQRVELETARREATEAARRAEAKRSREEAEEWHNAELTRLRNEEEALRAATEEEGLRRSELENAHKNAKAEIERLNKERVQLAAAEAVRHAEATRLRQEAKTRHEAEVTRLRSEEEALRALTEQVARRRAEVGGAHQEAEAEIERLAKVRAQLVAAESARHDETERIREAEERNRADHEQLRLELEKLRLVAQEISTRRAEVEAARKKSDEEAHRLLETQARMRDEEEARARVESERVQVEAEIHQRLKTQQRLLEEARRRDQEEQQRMENEARRHAEHEEKRRAELVLIQRNAETLAHQRAEEEKQIRSQVDSLRIADAEARKRIEEAEARRRKSEDVYRLVAEKVQRVEAEAHLRTLEEEKILAKLEAVRRSAAVEAQARAEQEKRIKEEIELFRRLEDVERPRLEVAALQRTQAQGLFQQQRDRARADEETRGEAEEPLTVMDELPQPSAGDQSLSLDRLDTADQAKHTVEKLEPERPTDENREKGTSSSEDQPVPGVTAAIQTYLNSVDPYKRAAAVSELARSNTADAFGLIVNCFDDHSPHVRNAATRALFQMQPTRTVDLFNRALEAGSEQRRRNIGSAIAASGLATEAIDNLVSDNREDTYNALSILFVMAKTGEVQPLVQAIHEHPNGEVSEAAVKLLTLSGQSEIAHAALKRRSTGKTVGSSH